MTETYRTTGTVRPGGYVRPDGDALGGDLRLDPLLLGDIAPLSRVRFLAVADAGGRLRVAEIAIIGRAPA
jgi:hypothetical protein